MSRHVIWNPAYLRPKSKRDNTERSFDHGSSFCGLVERVSLLRSWRSKKKGKLIFMLHYYDCFYYGTGVSSYNMVVCLMPILWSRYWFLCYVCSLNICIVGQILVPILYFLVQCLYYEADTDSYIIFVGPMLVLWAVDSMRKLWSR
jgi:hypothetical protein